jgi:hypothetical protein
VGGRASFIIDIISDVYGHRSNPNAWLETIAACRTAWWQFGSVAAMVKNLLLKRDDITGPSHHDLPQDRVLYIEKDDGLELTEEENRRLRDDEKERAGRKLTEGEERYRKPWTNHKLTGEEILHYFCRSWQRVSSAALKDVLHFNIHDIAVRLHSHMIHERLDY